MPAAAPTVATLPVTPRVTYEETSLHLPVGMGFDDWCAVGASLQQMHRSFMWWLGDWAFVGEQRFPEIYHQAVESYSQDRVNRALSVRRVFPENRRRAIGWTFHYAIKELPENEQDELLDKAVDEGWNRLTFREVLRERKAAKEAAEKAALQPDTMLQLAPPTGDIPPSDYSDDAINEESHRLSQDDPAEPPPAIVESSEPAPTTMAEAILLLEASLDILPYDIRVATEMLLRQHALLNDVLDAAADSLRSGWMMPSLERAVKAADSKSRLTNAHSVTVNYP